MIPVSRARLKILIIKTRPFFGPPFDYLKASARYVAQGSLAYRFRWHNRNLSAQLNVSNLFDHDEPVFTGTAVRAATATTATR